MKEKKEGLAELAALLTDNQRASMEAFLYGEETEKPEFKKTTDETGGREMNEISKLRQEVREKGSATIDIDRFNTLQEEWITRAVPELPEDLQKEMSVWLALKE